MGALRRGRWGRSPGALPEIPLCPPGLLSVFIPAVLGLKAVTLAALLLALIARWKSL